MIGEKKRSASPSPPYILTSEPFFRHHSHSCFRTDISIVRHAKDGSPYLAIFCHVRKKDVPKFLAALEDLKKSMILCGHPHYEDEISSIMDKMEKMKGAQHGDENDAAQETEQKRTA